MTAAPALFDAALLARRQRRAVPALKAALAGKLAEDIVERTAVLARDFDSVLITGPVAAEIALLLRQDPRFGALDLTPRRTDYACILSLAELQSLDDPLAALVQYRRLLRPDGLLIACLFGGGTLKELRAAWLAAELDLHGGASPRVAPMAELRDLGGLLQRAGLALPVADMDRTRLRHASPLALMAEIKGLGLSNPLMDRSRRPVSRGLLARAAAAYPADADGRTSATLDLAWLTAWAPHESQQQPLKPGSAKARLADALKVEEVRLKR